MSNSSDEFRKVALEHRFELLGSLSFIYRKTGQGASATAYAVTQEAIKQGFVEPRNPVSGAVFDKWIREGNPPAWAVKGALFLLLKESEFSPRVNEMAAVGLTLAELFPDDDAESLLRFFDGGLAELPWSDVLALACQARKVRMSKSE